MSLRDEAITHMAEVIQRSAFNTEGGDDPAFGVSWAADTLDALLDFLQANREAWTEASLHLGTHEALVTTRRIAVSRLVAALRGTTEEQ